MGFQHPLGDDGRLPIIPAFLCGAGPIDQLEEAQHQHGQMLRIAFPEVLDLLGHMSDVHRRPVLGADRRGLALVQA